MGDTIAIEGRLISISRIGSGPPLVCLPGGPGFPGAQLGHLGGVSRAFTLLRLDWRGSGASDPPADGRHGISDYASDLFAVQDALDLERVVLFGHSFGGIVAATYAARFSDRVSRLILDGTPDLLSDGRAPVGGVSGYFASWNEDHKRYAEQIMASLFAPAWEWFEAHEYATYDLAPCLPAITAKTLVITGHQDWAAGPKRATAMANAIADAEVAVIHGAGHFAWVEQPDAYTARLATFLG